MNRLLAYGLAALLFLSGTLLLIFANRVRKGDGSQRFEVVTAVPDEAWKNKDWITEYQLVERSGETFDSRSLTGSVHIVSFFFTTCPTACPLQNTQVQLLHQAYGQQGVRFVSITCDPERDTPEQLREYAQRYRANDDSWVFLTGALAHIQRIGAEMYSVPVDKLTHSEKLIVVDRWGKVRGKFHWSKTEELAQLRLLVDRLLVEKEPPADPPAAPRPADSPEEDEDEHLPAAL